MRRFLGWLLPTKQQTLVLDVAANPAIHRLPVEDLHDALESLERHPGFQHLLSGLALQRAALEKKLRSEWHESIREVTFLQSGIHWLSWLEKQVSQRKPILRPATEVEEDLLESLKQGLELIGMDPSSDAPQAG